MNAYIKKMSMAVLVVVLVVLFLPMQVLAAATGTHEPVSGITVDVNGATDNSMTSGAITVTAKGSAGFLGMGSSSKTATITVTNSGSSTATVSFNWTATSVNQLTIDGTIYSGASGSFSKVMNAGASFTITVTTAKDSTTNTFVMNSFGWTAAAASSTVTFQYNNALGSIKVAGTAVAAGGSAEIPSSGAEVVATPVSGAAFVGWIDSEHKIISTAATHTLNPASNMTVTAAFASAATDAWFSVDSTYAYNSLHDAANSAGASKVVLMNDGTLFGSHTIPAGVTLLIPFDSSNTLYTTEPGEVEGYSTTNIYRTLTMADGATLTVNGAMSLSNKVCYTSAKINQGSPSGYVSMVRMQGNSAINVYGALYAWGFITGSGSVTAYNGANVYECFQYMDYRGGGQSTESEMDSYDIFPLSQYYVQNIEVPLTLHYGATEYAHAIICAKPLTSYVAACSNVKFVGTSGSMFNLTTGGYITKTYDGSTDRLIVSVNGSATMSSINLVINKTILGDVSINSANYDLPINSNMTINVNSGTTTINQDIALLAGSELNIAAGATVQMGSGYNLFVYDTDQWEEFVYAENYSGTSYNQDGNYHNLRMRPLAYVPGRVSGVDRASQELPDAAIMVNGTLSANTGYIYTTYGPMTYKEGPTVGAEYINHYVTVDSENRGGANIYSTASTGKVILASGTTTEVYQVIQDPWHNGSDTDDDYYIAIPVSTAKLTNSNGELVSFGAGTYVYDSKSGAWYCETHTDVDTDHTCDVCGFTTECVDEVPEGETYADHKCDICGETISECADENSDSICDICGASLCAHDWVDADCDTPKTCSKCETTEGEPLGHTPGADATCTTNQVCTREGCGVELAAALGHNMVTDEAVGATCTETGLTAGEHCSRCDDATTAQEVFPALGHDYQAVVTAPTCTEQGYTTHTCATCGDSYKDTYVDALDHTWDDGTVTTIPTCSATGVKTFNCTVDGCNGIKTETVDKDPNNHKLVTDAAVAATCTKTGLTEGKHCEYCGTVTVTQTEVPALGHTEVVDAASAPTCTETGLTQGSHCSVCNKVLVAQTEVAAKGHAYGDGVITTAPTCTENGVRTFTCGTCSDSYTEVEAATGHSAVEVPAVAATCEATGLTAGTKCQTCGATITAQQTVAALGHNFANYTSNNDATCISDGTKTATCTRCDATDTVADVDSKLGHDFQSYTSDNNATCAADGTKTAKCEREGCEATDTIDDEGSQTTVHTWGEYVSNEDATCTKDGTETAPCTVCKTATDTRTDEGSKLDHTYSSVVTAPTCTASGYTTYTCSCGDTYTSDEVTALGHTEVAQEAVAETCTEDGLTAGEYCSVCSEVLVAQEVVPKKGHSYSGAVTEPTCTEDGYTTYACSGCGDSYVDDHTEATGHSYNEVVTAPTCTEDGYTTYACSGCGDSYVADEVAAKGHDYNAVVTAPTCTAEGFTTYTCACGDSYVADKEPATGHSYGEWVQTTAPTCTEDGEKTRTCACGDQETETVAALGHTDGDPVVENKVDATCGTSGSYDTVVYCSVCKAEVSRVTTTVDALGHSYSSNVTTEPTCTEAGVKTFTCGTCGDTYTEAVAALGHDEVSHDAQAPTCIDIGWDAYVTCSRCDYTTKVELPVIAHSDSAEDTDHICDTEGCDEVMNDCSDAEGDEDHSCDICGAENISTHSWNDATCTAPKTCSECGATEGTSNDHNYTTSTVAPTCTTSGYTTYTCSGCGDTYTDDETEATGHVNTTTTTVDATCVADGSVTVTCDDCGTTISTETIPATGEHTYGEDGKCTICGAEKTNLVDVIVTSKSLHLEGAISINLFLAFEGQDFLTQQYIEENGGVLVWKEDNAPADLRNAIHGSESYSIGVEYEGPYKNHIEYLAVSEEIPAACYAEKLYFRPFIKVNEEYVYGEVLEYNVKTYCEGRFEKSSNLKLKHMLVAILNYGAASQKYFNYKTDVLANADLQLYVDKGWIDASMLDMNWEDNYLDELLLPSDEMSAGFVQTAMMTNITRSLHLEGAISINYFVTIGEDAEIFKNATESVMYFWTSQKYAELEEQGIPLSTANASYTLPAELVYTNGYGWEFTVTSESIPAAYWGNSLYSALCVTDLNGDAHCSGIITYSPDYFAYRKINDNTVKPIDDVSKWLAIYSERAKTYFFG